MNRLKATLLAFLLPFVITFFARWSFDLSTMAVGDRFFLGFFATVGAAWIYASPWWSDRW